MNKASLSHRYCKSWGFLFAHQVHNLAPRHLPPALATAHSEILKPSPTLTLTPSLSKTSFGSVKSNYLTDTSSDRGRTDVNPLPQELRVYLQVSVFS